MIVGTVDRARRLCMMRRGAGSNGEGFVAGAGLLSAQAPVASGDWVAAISRAGGMQVLQVAAHTTLSSKCQGADKRERQPSGTGRCSARA